ncbi:hypothetical protein BS50DRAFT_600854 [Corynespora cassiicola Philippines]|uniref:DUF6594 domain-containing protein n=1 Tax=Corynespora cassiicola Philippines TaxID=1448308 RepID=A0A2T2NQE4_CORCC|nr:hypothetical protein BS50DRAFT_600854 [Corynespora cassiicola Philippines]
MSNSSGSPTEKQFGLFSAPTPCSTTSIASSSNSFSQIYLNSVTRFSRRLGLSRSKCVVDDTEAQVETPNNQEANEVEDDNESFKASGPERTKVRNLEGCPMGYPRLAAFNASEQNFMLYRSFNYVHSRLLLNLQTSIQALEAELDEIDRFHDVPHDRSQLRLQSWDLDLSICDEEKKEGIRTRNDILEDLRVKVCQYDELLTKSREITSFQRPTDGDYNSVRNWFKNKAPLVSEEQDYILWKEDIVTLRHGREWANFDGMVEQMLHKINCSLVRRLFCTDDLKRKTSDGLVHYYSPSRVAKLVNLIITTVIFILLAAPVLSMYQLSTLNTTQAIFAAIGVLMIFTLLFAAAMSLLTKARRHELFAASAAYCAVLVVFIGSTNFE